MSAALPDFGELRDPAALAEARRVLEQAERRVEANAAADRMRAEAEAKRTAEAEFHAEIASVRGPMDAVDAAQASLDELQGRRARIVSQADTASAAYAHARGVLPALVARAGAGEAVTAAEVNRTYEDVASAERYRNFLTEAVAHLAPLIASAESALKIAIAEAHVGVRTKGIELRLQAAQECEAAVKVRPGQHTRPEDRIGLLPGTTLDAKCVEAARRTFDRANAMLRYAAAKGVPMPRDGITMTWPSQLLLERAYWSQVRLPK
ncbi:hypothetical protein E2C06_30625 [Dankookia rubra]|uniref:Uncharacterized protein n=1 Tax=Dankookia rubra TaxID=1442381 RepID=A0A4V3A9D4_9PROT|nr:hypothetical protein [Dankookia rubra]TDH58825.1 hypothetical protein E2C06_30625 [Dankookia rubra]